MRMMMKVIVPIEAANRVIQDGSVKALLQNTLERLRPEAAYFFPTEEGRTMLFFVDVKEPSDIPAIGEPLFQALTARISFTPVMNLQDFQAGMAKVTAERR